jgi:hypothetical protein
MSIIAINDEGVNNRVENEVFFLVELLGTGYLNNETDWEARIQNNVFISLDNFIDGIPAIFDEIPVGVLEAVHPGLRPNIRVYRRTTVHVLEEVVL